MSFIRYLAGAERCEVRDIINLPTDATCVKLRFRATGVATARVKTPAGVSAHYLIRAGTGWTVMLSAPFAENKTKTI